MKTGVITAVLAALSMATLGIFSRKIALDASIIIFFRMGFGALFLLMFLMIQKKLFILQQCRNRSTIIRLVGSGFFLAGFALCYFYGLTLTTLANAVIILYLAPVVAAVFAHFFLGEKLTIARIVLILTALFGFAMMMEFQFDITTFGGNDKERTGLIYSLLSMVFYAGFIITNRLIAKDRAISSYAKTLCQLLFATCCLLPFTLNNMTEVVNISFVSWIWLMAVGFIPGFLGVLLAVIALEKLSAVTFGTLSYLEPIFVVFFGWFLFHETLSPLQVAGCATIIVSGMITGVCASYDDNRRNLSNCLP